MLRTAKSCGPDAPTLASSLRRHVGPTGLRQPISADDGGKQARSPGRARRKPLKPLRAGTSGDSGVLVVTRVRSTTTKCTRGRGCQGHPAFPTPSLGVRFINGSGAWRRGTKTRVEVEARTSQPVVPANAGIHNHRTSLLCRGVSAVFQFQRHGVWVPAFAGTTAGLAFMHTPIPLPPLILPARCRY